MAQGFDNSEFDFLLNFLKWGSLGLSPSARDQAERTAELASWDMAVWSYRTSHSLWHLILCGYHLEILNNFILQCVFCKWRLMTAEQEGGVWSPDSQQANLPRLRFGFTAPSPLGMALGGVGLQCIQGQPGSSGPHGLNYWVGPGCLWILFPCEYPHDQDNERLNTN